MRAPSPHEFARAEQAGWAAVREAGLDPSDDSHLWQTVFFAAQRAELEGSGRPDRGDGGLGGRPSG
jgi:hypothetical protein